MIPGIIPARAGSQRLPGKNLLEIGGKSLIERAVDAAVPSLGRDNVYVTTNDPAIKAEAHRLGVNTIDRPERLATPTATAKDTALHALETIPGTFDTFVYLQPTSPLRTAEDVEGCLALFREKDCETVVTLTESEVTPGRFWRLNGTMRPYFDGADPFKRRQDQARAYRPNGAVYVCDRAAFVASTGLSFLGTPSYGYEMPHARSIDIDTELDYRLAQVWMENAS